MKKAGIIVTLLIFVSSLFAQNSQNNVQTSMAMFNYIGTQTLIIEQSKNNRLLLEEIFNKFVNNTNPSVIDTQTQSYLKTLLDNIDDLRLNTLQREKVQFIYENQKAQDILQAILNPLYLLTGKDKVPLKIIMEIALKVIDSEVDYNALIKTTADVDLIIENFDIQKEELIPLSSLKKDYFNHMIDITRINNLDGNESLSQESIERFVSYLLDTNKQRTREWLEQNRNLYAKYAPYWLALADI